MRTTSNMYVDADQQRTHGRSAIDTGTAPEKLQHDHGKSLILNGQAGEEFVRDWVRRFGYDPRTPETPTK